MKIADLESIFLITFIVIWVTDLFLVPIALRKGLSIDNRYYRFHQKYGLVRTSILKFFFGLLNIHLYLALRVHRSTLFVVFICSAYLMSNLFKIWRAAYNVENESKRLQRSPLDSLMGLLVLPFEYLDTKKPFYAEPLKSFNWSWGALLLPEWWYLNHEILGAGYLSLALIYIYMNLFSTFGGVSLVFIVLIWIISGLYGKKIYYSRWGEF